MHSRVSFHVHCTIAWLPRQRHRLRWYCFCVRVCMCVCVCARMFVSSVWEHECRYHHQGPWGRGSQLKIMAPLWPPMKKFMIRYIATYRKCLLSPDWQTRHDDSHFCVFSPFLLMHITQFPMHCFNLRVYSVLIALQFGAVQRDNIVPCPQLKLWLPHCPQNANPRTTPNRHETCR